MNILFISDFFEDQLLGGAELNDAVLISHLRDRGFTVTCINSPACSHVDLQKTEFVILSNFVGLKQEVYDALVSDGRYLIYEHDHKYVSTRDPSKFESFKIPGDQIVNEKLYKNARKIITLSSSQKKLIVDTLGGYESKAHSIGCSLWPSETFSLIKELLSGSRPEDGTAAIVDSRNPIKRTSAAVSFAEQNNIEYDLIKEPDHKKFLTKLSKYKKLIFLPGVLESLSRLYVEARMLGLEVLTTPILLGASYEEWNTKKGLDLVEQMEKNVENALDYFVSFLREQKGSLPGMFRYTPAGYDPENEKKKIAFIGKFRRIYDEEGKARALEEQGYEVMRFDEDSFNRSTLNNLDALFASPIEAVFFTKLRVPYAKEVVQFAKARGIKTVCWVPDLYFGLPRENSLHKESRSAMFEADYVFTPDGGPNSRWLDQGINHFLMRQAIAKQAVEFENMDKKIDILFVGSLNKAIHGSDRSNLIKFLSETYGDRFFWAGRENTHSYRGRDLTKLIASSKIVIGDSVDSVGYWSNRIYETLGRKGFMLHVNIEGLEEEYKIGEHLDVFTRGDFQQLEQKINFYLNQPLIRERIATAGYEYTRERHTLSNRARQLIEVLETE